MRTAIAIETPQTADESCSEPTSPLHPDLDTPDLVNKACDFGVHFIEAIGWWVGVEGKHGYPVDIINGKDGLVTRDVKRSTFGLVQCRHCAGAKDKMIRT